MLDRVWRALLPLTLAEQDKNVAVKDIKDAPIKAINNVLNRTGIRV